jgi:hypothetical protein
MPTRTIRRVSERQARSAIDRIGERRADHLDDRGRHREDPDLERFSDDPADLLNFVCSCQRVPEHVLRDDVLDALTVLEYVRRSVPLLPGQANTWEYELLVSAQNLRLHAREVAERLGLSGTNVRQAIRARILRHESQLRGGPRSEAALVAARRAESRERGWLARNGAQLCREVDVLLTMRGLFAGDDLEEEFDDLTAAFAAWPPDSDSRYLKLTRSAGLHLRVMLTELKLLDRSAQLSELLSRLGRLAEAHRRTVPDEH